MIYVEKDVPLVVKDLFSQKAEKYLALIKEIGRKTHEYYYGRISTTGSKVHEDFFSNPYDAENFDGFPCCGIVSELISTALDDRGMETKIIVGDYKKEKPVEHEWFYLWHDRKTYSIDMTHKQTGSDKMIVVIPYELEKDFGLRRLFKKRLSGSVIESYSSYIGKYAQELYDLFRN